MRDPRLSRLLLVLATLPFLWGATRVRVTNALDGWFVEGDPVLAEYRAFQREFGNDEVVFVALEDDAPAGLGDALGAVPYVRAVVPAGARVLHVFPTIFPEDDARAEMLGGLRGALDAAGARAHLAGVGVLFHGINEASETDLARLMLPAALVCALLLLAGLGDLRRVGLALLAMAVSALWSLGLFGLAGVPLNLVTTMVPTLVAVLGLANALHLLRDRPDGAPVRRACLFSALTSAAAFLALTVSDVRILRELGLFAAAGLVCSFLVALLVCGAPRARGARPDRIGPGLARFGGWVLRRRALAVAALLGLAAVALLGNARLRVDTDSMGLLPADHPVRRDSDWIERHVGWYLPLQMRLDRPATPALLAALNADPRLGTAEAFGPIVTVRARMQSASALKADMDRAVATARRALGPNASVRPAGYLPVYFRFTEYLGTSFLESLPLAIALNFVLLLVLVRSLRWAVLGTIPNLLPVALLLGAMGWLGVHLDVAAISIACVAFGIVVDDTIHLVVHSRARIAAGADPRAAALAALRHGGSAVFWTTAVLVCGFATFVTAQVVPVRMFGTLLAATLVVGLLCDLVLVPLLVAPRRSSP